MRLASIALVAVFAAACATPAPSGDAPTEAAQAKKTCKRTMVMGSNVPQSICHTEEEWAAIAKRDQENVDDFERARRTVGPVAR